MLKMLLWGLLLLMGNRVFAQRLGTQFPSREEKAYYAGRYDSSTTHRCPIDSEEVLNFTSPYYKIKPYPSSARKANGNKINLRDQGASGNSMNRKWKKKHKKIGGVSTENILKYGERGTVAAFIYTDSKYSSGIRKGVWIAYSKDSGKTWVYYYTGMIQKQPVYVQASSTKPLIGEDGKLRINAVLMRQLTPWVRPGGFPTYECIEDSLYVVFNMQVISKDSDRDGLTDVVEDLFGTDKYSEDTDGDGIPDKMDMNPRKNAPRTELTKVYEAIFNTDRKEPADSVGWRKLVLQDDSSTSGEANPRRTEVIYTEKKDMLGMVPKNVRVLFFEPGDKAERTSPFSSGLKNREFSPLFPVDGKKDTFKIRISDRLGGREVLVQKRKEGWFIKLLFGWII